MYVILYYFKVKPERETQFIDAWKALTRLIRDYENSLGSRLHKQQTLHYVAYAQWRSKTHFENSGRHLPENANVIKAKMQACCEEITIIKQLEVIEDLLI